MRTIIIYSLLLLSLWSRNALSADRPVLPKKGFVFGIQNGAGFINTSVSTDKNNFQSGHMAYNWKLGWMLNPKTALLLQGGISTYMYGGSTEAPRQRLRGFEGLIPSVQCYPAERIWVAAGMGIGMDNPVFYDVKNQTEGKYYYGGFKTSLSAGYEFFKWKNKALDLQGRISYGTATVPEGKRNSLAFDILLGFNLF
jgi:hypothetical protein